MSVWQRKGLKGNYVQKSTKIHIHVHVCLTHVPWRKKLEQQILLFFLLEILFSARELIMTSVYVLALASLSLLFLLSVGKLPNKVICANRNADRSKWVLAVSDRWRDGARLWGLWFSIHIWALGNMSWGRGYITVQFQDRTLKCGSKEAYV